MRKIPGIEINVHLSKIAFKYMSGDLKSGLVTPDSTSATQTLSLPLLLSSYSHNIRTCISNYSNTSVIV
jgi:hypothetical protein